MKWFLRILIGVITLGGIGLMGYPLLSNYLYERQQSELAAYYQALAKEMLPEERSDQWDKCDEYNEGLLTGGATPTDAFGENRQNYNDSLYESLLNLRDDGAMGSLSIPGIAENLIIYHGTSEDVLQKGVGHLYGTSLPVGGKSTHCVLSAHTGLSGKKLFTNLDQMKEGDVFYLDVLGERLAYKVDQISVVLPNETDKISIEQDKDYVTLITCTPYGVNSHRLLVRGTRITHREAAAHKSIEIQQQKSISTWVLMYVKAVLVGLAIAAALGLIIWMLRLIRKFN